MEETSKCAGVEVGVGDSARCGRWGFERLEVALGSPFAVGCSVTLGPASLPQFSEKCGHGRGKPQSRCAPWPWGGALGSSNS